MGNLSMKRHTVRQSLIICVFGMAFIFGAGASNAFAQIISGTITHWKESSSAVAIGDGTNEVHAYWSAHGSDKGWFYGAVYTGDTDVAHAVGATAVDDIFNASMFDFTWPGISTHIGPLCDADCDPDRVGDFIVLRGHLGNWGVLRIDDIYLDGGEWYLDGTWWFQQNQTAKFSPVDCNVQLDQPTYSDGAPVNLSLKFSNSSTSAVPVEFKVWVEAPGITPLTITRGGADGAVVFPAGFTATPPPFTVFTVGAQHPRGTYRVGCRLVHPVTGKTKAQDQDLVAVE